MKSVLVTGATGFVGQHLVRELLSSGIEVKATGHTNKSDDGKAEYLELDLTKPGDVKDINFKDFDGVIHLAGLAAVGRSFAKPMDYIKVNMGIEINLLEECLRQSATPKFLIISSGSLYDPAAAMPLTEASSTRPSSPYSVSKLGQEQLAVYYGMRGFECVIARPFNHFGPGQKPGFIVPDLVEQALNFKAGKVKEVKVGNLAAKRDYTDVRDIVKAYALMLDKARPGEVYNVCSGKSLGGQQILEAILKEMAINPKVTVDSSKLRPTDADNIYGSYDKLHQATDWQPEISFETTIKDIVSSLS